MSYTYDDKINFIQDIAQYAYSASRATGLSYGIKVTGTIKY